MPPDPEALLPAPGADAAPRAAGGAASAPPANGDAADDAAGITCGIGRREVFGVNRNSLVLIIQLLSIVLGAVSAGLTQLPGDNARATVVLGTVVAALNGVAALLKADPGPTGAGAAKAAGLV